MEGSDSVKNNLEVLRKMKQQEMNEKENDNKKVWVLQWLTSYIEQVGEENNYYNRYSSNYGRRSRSLF